MKQFLVFLLLFLVVSIPFVLADEEEEEEGCSIFELEACFALLPELFVDYILGILVSLFNAGVAPLLLFVQQLMQAEVNYEIFASVWQTVVALLSSLYVVFLTVIGYKLLFVFKEPERRAHAKKLLIDWFIMLVLVSGSYYLYGLLINFSSNMTQFFLNQLDPSFFTASAHNLSEVVTILMFQSLYMLIIFILLLALGIRYIIISLGIVLFPIGLCFTFIPFLRPYGKIILHTLGVIIFLPVLHAMIFLATSALINATSWTPFLSPLFVLAAFVIAIWSTFVSFGIGMKVATIPGGFKIPRPVFYQNQQFSTTNYNIEGAKK